jgi:RND family efflux transporter MFP subunit
MSKRWPLLVVALLAIGVAAASYFWLFSRPTVIVVSPRVGPAVQAVYATGTVEPVVMLPIAPRIGARLVQLAVDEGAVVRKGDVLARLESEDVTNNVTQLAAEEDFARRDYLRNEALVKGGFVARQTYDKSKSAWDAARAAVAAARAQIGYMTLTAPTDGRIIRRDGEVGQFLPVNQPLFWLSCLSPLRISADVDEEDIATIKIGQRVLIRADAFPGRTFSGQVQAITPKGDPIARSYRVRITLTENSPLQIGMTAETNIVTYEKPRALLVPTSAVSGGTIWLVRDGRLARQAVSTGISGKSDVEITHGIALGDNLVMTPDAAFVEGTAVNEAHEGASP